MPYTKEHKQRTRQRILKSAFELFSRKGFDNVSIDELMKHAGLTRGGFYAHFKNKAEVYAEAIASAVDNSRLARMKPDDMDDQVWIKGLLDSYLSQEHIHAESQICPLAFFATDVAIRDSAVRKAYAKVYANLNKQVAGKLAGEKNAEEAAFAVTAMMIGGLAISRVLCDGDIVDKLLGACRKYSWLLLNSRSIENLSDW